MNKFALLKALMGNWELLFVLGEVGPQLAQAHTTVERWEVVKPVGDRLAPAIDQIMATMNNPAQMQIMSTEAELEETLLNAFQNEYIEQNVKSSITVKTLAADADEATKKQHALMIQENEKKVRAAATEEAKKRFNGEWLRLALQVFQIVGPMLGTLIVK